MEAERGANRLGRHLALLQREERLLELRHDLAFAHQPQIAAARRRRRILGDFLRELAEVRSGLCAADDVGDLRARLVLPCAAAGLRHANEHVGRAHLTRRLELAGVLGIELLDVGVGHRAREVLRVQGHVLHATAIGLPELVGMLREIGRELLVGGVGAGEQRRELHERPRRAHLLAPQAERLFELGLRDLDAAPDRRFDLGACQLASDLGLERGGGVPAPLEDLLVSLEREAAVFLEERDRVDPRIQLLVTDREPLGVRPLDDQRLLHEIAENLLRQTHALGQLRRKAIAIHLRVRLEVRLIAPLESLDGNRLAVDRRHRITRLAPAAGAGPGHAEDEQRGDERRDDHQQADLEQFAEAPHQRDHQRSPTSGC